MPVNSQPERFIVVYISEEFLTTTTMATTEEFPESPLELLHLILDSFRATIDSFWENVALLKTMALEMDQTSMAVCAALAVIILTQAWSKIVPLSFFLFFF